MSRHRHLFALLLVVVYTAMSTLGLGFVVCEEADGSRNVEALGAACCSDGLPSQTDPFSSPPSIGSPSGDDGCGPCQSHTPAIEIVSPTVKNLKAENAAADPILGPALPATIASPTAALLSRAGPVRAPPPRPSPTVACLRSVVLRC